MSSQYIIACLIFHSSLFSMRHCISIFAMSIQIYICDSWTWTLCPCTSLFFFHFTFLCLTYQFQYIFRVRMEFLILSFCFKFVPLLIFVTFKLEDILVLFLILKSKGCHCWHLQPCMPLHVRYETCLQMMQLRSTFIYLFLVFFFFFPVKSCKWRTMYETPDVIWQVPEIIYIFLPSLVSF